MSVGAQAADWANGAARCASEVFWTDPEASGGCWRKWAFLQGTTACSLCLLEQGEGCGVR